MLTPFTPHRSLLSRQTTWMVTSAAFAMMLFPGAAAYAQLVQPVEKLGPAVNSSLYDESSPVISADGRTLFFTRTGSPEFDRTLIYNGEDIALSHDDEQYRGFLADIFGQIAGTPVNDPFSSVFNQDIWIAYSTDSLFDMAMHPGFPVNNALPNSAVSTALDSTRLVVINQFYKDGSMYEGFSAIPMDGLGGFGTPEPLHIYDFYNLSDDVNLAFSRGGSVMIISAERKDSYGKNDLYVSFRLMEDLWSTPSNIGDAINSPEYESAPFITDDGRKLYFSSTREGTTGGTDIWVSERQDFTWLKWSEPVQLKAPVNSMYDDSEAYINKDQTFLYFTSRRDGTSDIFRMPLTPPERLESPIVIHGQVVHGETGKPLRAELYYGPRGVRDFLEYFHTYTGLFEFTFEEPDVYKFLAVKPGFKVGSLHFDTRIAKEHPQPFYEVVIELFPEDSWVPASDFERSDREDEMQYADLRIGDKLSFYNIYFERGKASILTKSGPALDELAAVMQRNPSLMIQIEGHTDNVGDEGDLVDLSWQRAEAIKGYLVEKGISGVRISTIGFGPRKPVTDNATEEDREKNRRVEVRIISK